MASEDCGQVQVVKEGPYKYCLVKGDYSPLLTQLVRNLKEAELYAASETQRHMIQAYARSFTTGNLQVRCCIISKSCINILF